MTQWKPPSVHRRRWVDTKEGPKFKDRDPDTEEVGAHVPGAGRPDAHRAIEAAAEAFESWSRTAPAQRQSIFLRAAVVLEQRTDEVAFVLARETGRTVGFGAF